MRREKLALYLTSFVLLMLLAACGAANEQDVESAPADEGDNASVEVEEMEESEPEEVEVEESDVEEEETAVSETEATEIMEEEETEEISADGVRTFTIVAEESEASYTVGEEFLSEAVSRLGVVLGLTETVGSTNEVEGEFELDLNDPFPLVANHFTVNIRSLTSDQSRRDERIQEQSLESNKYPIAEFTATAIEDFPESYTEGEEISFKLIGDLTIREISNPVTFDMTATLDGNSITGNASTIILMSDYGFAPPSFANFFVVEDETLIQLTFTAKESS